MPTSVLNLFAGADGDITTSGIAIRIALVCCSIFAVVQLFSLWGTKYGDHHTLSKSLFLSLVLHGCLGLGWATVAQNLPKQVSVVDNGPGTINVPISFVNDTDSAPTIGKNDMPVFVKGPSRDGPFTREAHNPTRFMDSETTIAEIANPQINETPTVDDIREIPDFASLPQETAPDLDRSDVEASRSPADGPNTLDQQPIIPESKPRNVTRSNVSRSGQNALPADSFDAPTSPSVKRGASTRLAPRIEEPTNLDLPSDYAADAPPKPQGTADQDALRKPETPSPSEFDDGQAGSLAESSSNNSQISNPRRATRSAPLATRVNESSRDDLTIEGGASRPGSTKGKSRQSDTVPSDDQLLADRSRPDLDDPSPEPKLDKTRSQSGSRAPARAPETYRARTTGQRMSSVLKNGGSAESEKAVEDSLKWFSSIQDSDGHWSAATYGGGADEVDKEGQARHGGGKFADTGITGLVVLSFLGAGYTHEKGPYTNEVRKALEWLINQQMDNGYLGGESKYYDQNYCHAMATFAIAEAYAMQANEADFPELRSAVKSAVSLICSMQNPDGGWRYQKGVPSDMSMFGWQVMALKSAVNGGVSVPEKTRIGMVRFLNGHAQGDYGGLAGYKKGDRPTPAMTAEALFCRQLFSVKANDPAAKEAVTFLRKRLPNIRNDREYDEYYWYYGTLAMRNQDEESWREWNASLRDLLINLQVKQGRFAGSWDPKGKWGGIGGRLYSTALSTMCLEVYYRYQSNNKPADVQ